ncbi:hypothetical protein WME98_10935 [Sorangium sp. So ce296]|uniref:hypothetical protein n=1 Tax=Sorangium sp. So ce296 TaxID=3133296 RepID=UPI003F62A4AB
MKKAVKTSGVITFPAVGPQRLVGSLACCIDEDGIGWIQISFFDEEEYLRVDEQDSRMCLTIRRELMETILGALSILFAANLWMRPAGQYPALSETARHFTVETTVARRGQPGLVRCFWGAGADGIEQSCIDGQVNLRFREDTAQELASELARELGRIAAAVDV